MNDADKETILNIAVADRKTALDWMQFSRLSHINRMKYEDGFVPPADHEKWVEKQISKGRSGKPTSVRGSIREAFEELTEEQDLFNKLADKTLLIRRLI